MTSVRGAVFDLNGTLLDDIQYHFEAFRTLAQSLGRDISWDDFQAWNGRKNEDIFPELLGRVLGDGAIAALAQQKEETYRALYRPKMTLLDGADALLARLRRAGVRLALASSAPEENRNMALDGLALRNRFDAIVEAKHLPGKPAPDVFLAAAKMLDVPADACVAFEDAENGVRAAAVAGMIVIGVTTNVPAVRLTVAGARFTTTNFASLPADLDALLPR